ncbi:dihydroorotate dehydrogenase-like protein [Carboxylicivirga sediminis]|uniref:Dihydroorotate dehydrogenase-like protein n=1 Tax=Carboxylicivirga sediminis TaxID=2006564 RepID=A0A941J352_9BACT|nr:dihydroorotate dehydrogenase-like protein [Carboxylicivirga sediminis]MBR8538257.1 dihydroorotate dehydrogenase-like protein [Carboxylicivirga sediminis]
MPDISTTYMGLKLSSPIIAASSGLTNSLEDIKHLEKAGAGAVVLKSLFEEEIVTEMERELHRMHSENYLYPETMDYYDTFDVEGTLSEYLKLINDCKKEVNIPVIASVNCITSHNWPAYARNLQDAGADAIELNIFSLPSDTDRKGLDNEQVYFDIIEAVLKEVNIPVAIKISHYFSNLADIITRLSKTGIAGLVLFNRFYSPDIDVDNLEVIPTHIFSQEYEYTMPLRWIALTSSRTECDLAATTGIHDSRTILKMLLAGAQVVQLASTLYKNGIDSIERFNYELDKWMQKHEFKTLDDLRGSLSQSKAVNPAGYLRVQFMKQFSQK